MLIAGLFGLKIFPQLFFPQKLKESGALADTDNAVKLKTTNSCHPHSQYLSNFYLPQQLLIPHPLSVMRSCSIKRVRSVYAIWKCFHVEEAWRYVAVSSMLPLNMSLLGRAAMLSPNIVEEILSALRFCNTLGETLLSRLLIVSS